MCEVKTATTLHLPQCAASHRSALSCVRGSSTTNTVTPHSSTCSQGWPVTTATLIITVEQALQCLRQTRLHVDSRTSDAGVMNRTSTSFAQAARLEQRLSDHLEGATWVLSRLCRRIMHLLAECVEKLTCTSSSSLECLGYSFLHLLRAVVLSLLYIHVCHCHTFTWMSSSALTKSLS